MLLAALGLSAWLLGPWGLAVIAAPLLVVLVWSAFFARRLGGLTGMYSAPGWSWASWARLSRVVARTPGRCLSPRRRSDTWARSSPRRRSPPGRASDVSTAIYLVRHGSVIGAETRRFIGHLDVPLSPLGERQIEALSRRLAPVAARRGLRQRPPARAAERGDPRRAARASPDAPARAPRVLDGHLGGPHRRGDPRARRRRLRRLDGRRRRATGFPKGRAWTSSPAGPGRPSSGSPLRIGAAPRPSSPTAAPTAMILCRALGLCPEQLLAIGQDYAALSILEGASGRWTLRLLNHCEAVA